jgi:uncharacterized protein
MTRYFVGPALVSLVTLIAVLAWGGVEAFLLAGLLVVLEVTLSFDNAVVNAKVLRHMSDVWQRRFLTWGILIAVVGTRLVLPVIIVSLAAFVPPLEVLKLVLFDAEAYGRLLESSHTIIGSFGGAFLLMVSLKYFFDEAKDVHWIGRLERAFARWGRIEAIEIALALVALLLVFFLDHHDPYVLVAGLAGVILFIAMEGITHALGNGGGDVTRAGIVGFVYLNVLDAAFSLDGVVAAFALTNSLIIIVVGLGLGAYFVRTLTVIMVKRHTLETLRYLEHGAHWAIGGLAVAMFTNLIVHVPELITGLIGLLFVGLAYNSSRRENRAL